MSRCGSSIPTAASRVPAATARAAWRGCCSTRVPPTPSRWRSASGGCGPSACPTAGSRWRWASPSCTGGAFPWPSLATRWRCRSTCAGLPRPVAVNMGNPHAVFFVERPRGDRRRRAGGAARAPPDVPGARQYRLRAAGRARRAAAARVRARCRADARLRQRRLCRDGRGPTAGLGGRPRPADPRRRRARGRLAGRGAGDHDRPDGQGLHGHCWRRSCSPMRAEPAVEIVTFGCRLNTLESEVMRRHARAAALDDTVIVHTCAVTAEAERQARQAIRRLRRQRPGSRIVVTGCGVAGGAGRLRGDARGRPSDRQRREAAARHLGRAGRRRPAACRSATSWPCATSRSSRSTASTGGPAPSCWSSRAATIAAPSAAFPSAAARAAACRCRQVVAQARALLAGGHVELTVTGVDIASYGRDLPGQPKPGRHAQGPAGRGARAAAAAAVLARPGRDRSRPARTRRRRAAAAAAPASVGPGRATTSCSSG